jgi:Fe-S cluster assembly protein SufD
MSSVPEQIAPWVASFERLEARRQAGDRLAASRRSALERFTVKGFPTTREEAWRFTNVAPIGRVRFSPAEARAVAAKEAWLPWLDEVLFGTLREESAAGWIVFLDGHYDASLSRLDAISPARLTSLARAIAEDGGGIAPLLEARRAVAPSPFTDLNMAFLEDGAFLSLPPRSVTERPIHIVYVATGSAPDRVVSPRTLIRAAEGSQARIVESYVGRPARCFTNAVTQIELEEGAVVEHCKLQREATEAFHVASTDVVMKRASAFTSHSIALGGGLSRNDINVLLDGEGADCTLNGLYVVSGDQHVDHHTVVDHARPHGTSRQLYKGVLDGRARGVFDGLVVVRPGAQKTDSRQENRNLILSEAALVDTKPTLQINADDVKCSHAATTGQLDEASTFYLRSRAIDPETARRIMIHAFVSDILRRVGVEAIRDGLDALLFGASAAEETPALAPAATPPEKRP